MHGILIAVNDSGPGSPDLHLFRPQLLKLEILRNRSPTLMNRTSRMGGFLHCDYVSVSSASSFFIHESSGYEAGWSTASAPWAQPLPSSHTKYTFLEITDVCAVGFFSKDLLSILAPELPVSVVLGP